MLKALTKHTAKGGDALTTHGVGDKRVALFFELCRGKVEYTITLYTRSLTTITL